MKRALSKVGSSPLTRGKRDGRPECLRPGRLIPTHAGKTTAAYLRDLAAPAHPHSRGENIHADDVAGLDLGSSPLTRGKLGVGVGVNQVGGLIPTHAGKTVLTTAPRRLSAAHPHSRGENPSTSLATA